MQLAEVISKAKKLIDEGKALGKDTKPLEKRLKVLEGVNNSFRHSDNSDKYIYGGTVGMSESIYTPDQVSLWKLSEVAKRNMAIEIYSELLGCSFWLCSNVDMVSQVKQDDPESVCYTVDEIRILIRLNPKPEELRTIHNAKSIFPGSKVRD